jgi:hypothetical protein
MGESAGLINIGSTSLCLQLSKMTCKHRSEPLIKGAKATKATFNKFVLTFRLTLGLFSPSFNID